MYVCMYIYIYIRLGQRGGPAHRAGPSRSVCVCVYTPNLPTNIIPTKIA